WIVWLNQLWKAHPSSSISFCYEINDRIHSVAKKLAGFN
ncbi:unnamed protein product, partial [marine sediment metagenome]